MDKTITFRVDIHSKYALDNFLLPMLEILNQYQASASIFTYFAKASKHLQNKSLWHYSKRTASRKLYNLRSKLAIYRAQVTNLANQLPLNKIHSANCQVGLLLPTNSLWANSFEQGYFPAEEKFINSSIINFRQIFPTAELVFAAEHWQLSHQSWRLLERLKTKYISATIGTHPYLPRWQGEVFATPELPTTLPAWHVMAQAGAVFPQISAAISAQSNLPAKDYQLLQVDLELIGQNNMNAFAQFISDCYQEQYKIASFAASTTNLSGQPLAICDLALNEENIANDPRNWRQTIKTAHSLFQGQQICNNASLHLGIINHGESTKIDELSA